jgi:Na+:H+ antiporter, NhaA family
LQSTKLAHFSFVMHAAVMIPHDSKISPDVLGGVALLTAAVAAMLFVNLGGAEAYKHGLEYAVTVGFAPLALQKTIHHWINDGLMVLFFLLVGIEIHREIRTGSLRTPRQALLPVIAAIGGFVTPAVLYVLVTGGDPVLVKGWSVPTATDIAFAVALVTVLKDRVPASLRVFLLALAVADDLLAILVIAIFYTADVIWMNLFLVAAAALLLVAKKRLGIQKLWVYVIVGLFMWLCVLKSGVHATVAGVIIGLLLPLTGVKDKEAPADTVEHFLQPWVRWMVLPLFAFANVGVDVRGLTLEILLSLLTWGIALGLFFGKQIGVFGTVKLLQKAGIPRPAGATWLQVYGIACMCGIGFTMSLFIGALALPPEMQPQVRLGVILGSVLSAALAVIVLTWRRRGSD